MCLFEVEGLKSFSKNILTKLEVSSEHALVVTNGLLKANLEGVESHGLSRLVVYSNCLKEKRINPKPNILFERKAKSVLSVNGDNGLGHVVSFEAIKRGIEIVKETGMVGIGIKNSNHFGTASYYCQMACDNNLAAIAFTNSPSGVAPWGGRKAFFGTNPIAFGFPTGNQGPIIIDLSTSVVARGKIILADKQGESIPYGWALNEKGEMTNDPGEALRGTVLPLGGSKGYALALAVEILTGVLSGATFGPHVNNIYQKTSKPANIGHFFILLDIQRFMPYDQFTDTVNQLLQELKSNPKMPGVEEIRFPGERRMKEFQKRMLTGVPLSTGIQKELTELGLKLDVSFPLPFAK